MNYELKINNDNANHNDNNDECYRIKKKNNLLPWSEKYRPENIKSIIYHDKITKAITNYMDNDKLPHLLFYGPPGTGKCLAINTPIIMYDGSIKKVQDIIVNDLLMGDDNLPRKVLNTTNGKDQMYEIIQKNGDNYIVNSEHIISLKLSKQFLIKKIKNNKLILYWFENHELKQKTFSEENSFLESNNYKKELQENKIINNYGDICDISIKEYLNKQHIWKQVYKGFKSNKITCWSTQNIPLDPYLFGRWLGNRLKDNNNIFSEEFKDLLKENNLIDVKYIPKEYKINDYETRIQLLSGYLKETGYGTIDNYYKFDDESRIIFNDIVFIARSLGFLVSCKKLKRENNNVGSIYGYESIYSYDGIHNYNGNLLDKCTEDNNILYYNIKIEKLNVDNYYGFEIDGNKRFLLGDFTVTHNTSSIIAIAKHYYKEDYDNMILVLNASEERGIETVRNRIKQFVICKGIIENKNTLPFKLIILDEIDAMTEDAQAILRKVIEKYVFNVRFCFICNYLKKINPAIQSRCVIFRFNPIPYDIMHDFIINICTKENIKITINAINLIIKVSNGDMRKLLNILQSIYMYLDKDNTKKNEYISITGSHVSKILSCPTKKIIENLLLFIRTNNINKSYYYLNELIQKNGISLIELINYVYEYCMDYIINENRLIINYSLDKITEIIKNISLINENLTYCNNDNIQLISFLSIFYL